MEDVSGPGSPAWKAAFGWKYDFVVDDDDFLQELRSLTAEEHAEAAQAASTIRSIQQAPLKDLVIMPNPWAWKGHDSTDIVSPAIVVQPTCTFPAPPHKDAPFTPEHQALAFKLVRFATAEMKVAVHGGKPILSPHAVVNPLYVAAALALHAGWFTKQNGRPNPSAALRALAEPDVCPPGGATGAVKAWQMRLQQLQDAFAAQRRDGIDWRIQLNGVKATELLRRGVTALTHCTPDGHVLGEARYRSLIELRAVAGMHEDVQRDPSAVRLRTCRGTCDGTSRRCGFGSYTCTCF